MNVALDTVGDPPPPGVRPPRHRPGVVVAMVALALCWACGGGMTDVGEEEAQRERFMGAYLDLRVAAVTSGSTDIGDAVRDSILTTYGVTEQDLLDFVDAHGEDVEFMSVLWTEVEGRLTARLEQYARDQEDGENE